jgi:hypothetical protein
MAMPVVYHLEADQKAGFLEKIFESSQTSSSGMSPSGISRSASADQGYFQISIFRFK